jgi:hypothetical protein
MKCWCPYKSEQTYSRHTFRLKLLLKVVVSLLENHKAAGLLFFRLTMNSGLCIVAVYYWVIILAKSPRYCSGETKNEKHNLLRILHGKLTSSKSDEKLEAWPWCLRFSMNQTVIRYSLLSLSWKGKSVSRMYTDGISQHYAKRWGNRNAVYPAKRADILHAQQHCQFRASAWQNLWKTKFVKTTYEDEQSDRLVHAVGKLKSAHVFCQKLS